MKCLGSYFKFCYYNHPINFIRVAEWYTALCSPHGRLWVQAPHLPQCLWTCRRVCKYVDWKGFAAMLTSTVSRCHTRGESEDHISKKACKGSTLALKPRADISRSPKQGYQWPHENDLCPPKTFFKKDFIFTKANWYGCEWDLCLTQI